MREIGKSAITANHTMVNIWDITIKLAPVLAYINALNAMNEVIVT
jgi:hypothetical protein